MDAVPSNNPQPTSSLAGKWRECRTCPGLVMGLVVIIGAATAFIFFGFLIHAQRKQSRARFNELAGERIAKIQSTLDRTLITASAFGALFESSERVTRDEFRRFSQRFLTQPANPVAMWIPRVSREDRAAMEASARDDGQPTFEIRECISSGGFQRAADRAEYFPVLFATPVAVQPSKLGLDLLGVRHQGNAILLARDTGRPTAWLDIEAVDHEPPQAAGLRLILPIYRPGSPPQSQQARRDRMLGCVLIVLPLESILKPATTPDIEIALEFAEPSITVPQATGGMMNDLKTFASPWQWEGTVRVADLPIPLVCRATRQFATDGDSFLPWIVLAAGLLLTWLVRRLMKAQSQRLIAMGEFNRELVRKQLALEITQQEIANGKSRLEAAQQELRATNLWLEGEIKNRVEGERELHAVYDHAPIMLGLVSAEKRITRCNQAMARYVNKSEDQLVGLGLGEGLGCRYASGGSLECRVDSRCDECRLWHGVQSTLESGDTTSRQEVSLTLTRNEQSVNVSLLVSCVLLELRGKMQVLLCLEDITEMKRVEAQLRQSQKMECVGQLAGGVAHDFNNLLAVVLSSAELLSWETSLSVQARELLLDISKSAKRGAGLTKQLLAFGRRSQMQVRACDLNAVIQDVLKLLQRLIGEQISMEVILAEHLPAIQADPTMLDQVILNLAINARDAMPRGGRLTIKTCVEVITDRDTGSRETAQPGRFVTLVISDSGCGMTPSTLQRIFEPFFTTKDVGKGTGLGLATVDGIVKQHKGWIEVVSQIGKGTTFKTFFPVTTAEPSVEEVSRSHRRENGDRLILLVEDETQVRRIVSQVLRRSGYQVIEATHADEAFTLWQQHGQDCNLLITDMVMPGGMNGLELARRLCELKPSLRAIINTGYSGEDLEDLNRLPFGTTVLLKPSTTEELLHAVQKSLGALDQATTRASFGENDLEGRIWI